MVVNGNNNIYTRSPNIIKHSPTIQLTDQRDFLLDLRSRGRSSGDRFLGRSGERFLDDLRSSGERFLEDRRTSGDLFLEERDKRPFGDLFRDRSKDRSSRELLRLGGDRSSGDLFLVE